MEGYRDPQQDNLDWLETAKQDANVPLAAIHAWWANADGCRLHYRHGDKIPLRPDFGDLTARVVLWADFKRYSIDVAPLTRFCRLTAPLWQVGRLRDPQPSEADVQAGYDETSAICDRLRLALQSETAGTSAGNEQADEKPAAVYLGNRRYQVGDAPPLVLQESEDTVLQALIVELSGAGSISDLRDKSGKPDAARVLKSITTKYTALAPFISLPGGKGKGGYRTTIRQSDVAKV